MKRLIGCRISGSFGNREIPLPVMLFYLFYHEEASRKRCFRLKGGAKLFTIWSTSPDLGRRHSQVGSLAGAAHLLKNNAGVLR